MNTFEIIAWVSLGTAFLCAVVIAYDNILPDESLAHQGRLEASHGIIIAKCARHEICLAII